MLGAPLLPAVQVADAFADTCIGGALINGAWHDRSDGREHALFDPSTGRASGTLICDDGALVGMAARAAARAAPCWRDSLPAERAAALTRIAAQIARRQETFARVIAAEMGAPINYARKAHVDRAVGYLHDTAAACLALPQAELLGDDWICYEPVGPVAAITPWNWPLNQMASKAALALAAGCPVILKPSEVTPRTARLFADALAAAALPDGLVSIVLGDGATGRTLVAHPSVAAVSCTASTEVGREVARSAAGDMKPAILELGGKCPAILFSDGVSASALDWVAQAAFRNMGQACNAARRVLVERKAYDRVAMGLAQRACVLTVGSAHQPGPHMGPLATERQRDVHLQAVTQACQEGADLLAGDEHLPAGGWFTRPTVVADVAPGHALFQDETFGPLLSVTPFDTEEEAVALAEDSAYGLSAYLHTADTARATRIAQRLSVGTVQVNGASRGPHAPFGGCKASGLGREQGPLGIRALQFPKSVSGADPASVERFNPAVSVQ